MLPQLTKFFPVFAPLRDSDIPANGGLRGLTERCSEVVMYRDLSTFTLLFIGEFTIQSKGTRSPKISTGSTTRFTGYNDLSMCFNIGL